ncbi:MAG TPA: serine/threonine-protein kinase [Polyangiaceae bacterium]|nr:serine/threonine-protein kinase [Polyangiaceae bacterium]
MSALRSYEAFAHRELDLPRVGDLVNQRYTVVGELGRGGMGVVLAAHDTQLDRQVALKVLLPRLTHSNEAIERFKDEAQSLARLDSPHVVRVLDFGGIRAPSSCAGLPFMVLELLRGEDLFSIASREGPLEPARVVRYALEACAGLAAAHAQGIVHRDLKPENLFVAIDGDGNECLKLLDFGIARSQSRRILTRANAGIGSPGYMSPEQVQGGGAVGVQADIWALGVVMYELLAHRPAFMGESPEALCAQTLTARVTPLGELRPELPRALVRVVERCLERAPEHRFADVGELATALCRLGDRPSERVLTVRVSRPPRRWARRVGAWLLAAALFAPAVLLLPKVAHAPELAPARAWSAQALETARSAWQGARRWAREMRAPADTAPPGAPEPQH